MFGDVQSMKPTEEALVRQGVCPRWLENENGDRVVENAKDPRDVEIERLRHELLDWMFTHRYIEVGRGGPGPYPEQWCVHINPCDGKGPRFYHHADFWEALRIAKETFPRR